MTSAEINPHKVVVFTGAGISAESGIQTFRGADGLWENHPIELVASPSGWDMDPNLVLNFYNQRRVDVFNAQPNGAHLAIANLEKVFDVSVITQNIDNLHERAGSSKVLHLHGEISKARSTTNGSLVYEIGENPIRLGDKCEESSQLRPHIVWFGEIPFHLDEAKRLLKEAAYVLVVGTSLQVQPAAGLLKHARFHAKKELVTLELDRIPFGFNFTRGKASELVPLVCKSWSQSFKLIK